MPNPYIIAVVVEEIQTKPKHELKNLKKNKTLQTKIYLLPTSIRTELNKMSTKY